MFKINKMVFSKKSIFILFAIGVIFVELLSEYKIYYDFRIVTNRPYYQWSFYTPDGKQIGNRRGILKLMYHPQLIYMNFPDQTTPYFSINSRGFRGREIKTKTKGRKRIIVVGG